MNTNGKISKSEAEYVDVSKEPALHCCDLCTAVRKDRETREHYCTLVEGVVEPLGGCKLFDLDLIKWANWPIEP